jgi:2-polyprenyl-3-methyl-5-hydroxy-6-metoxy-1,4-benzoquinol methylase
MAGKMIRTLEEFLVKNKATEVLDYGAGSSSFKKSLSLENISVYEYDPGVPEIDKTPEPRDFTVCIDVLEHIEPKLLDSVLKDLARVTKKKGYFTVAMYPAQRILKDGRNAHLIIENSDWWKDKLLKYFNITYLKEHNKQLEIEVECK